MRLCEKEIVCSCRVAGHERLAFFCMEHLQRAQELSQLLGFELMVTSLPVSKVDPSNVFLSSSVLNKCRVSVGYTADDFANVPRRR